MNSLYKDFNQNGIIQPVLPQNDLMQRMSNLAMFIRQNYGANATPEQVAKSMLANGQISKQAFDQACVMANMFTGRQF